MTHTLHWQELASSLSVFFEQLATIQYVIAPFIRPQVLAEMLSHASDSRRTVVLTSWRRDHLVAGVSSLETYELCKERGWQLFVNGRVHLKLYSCDLDSALVGSANVTTSALGDADNSNHEVLCNVALERHDRIRVQQLLAESLLVTDDVHTAHAEWLSSINAVENQVPPEDLVVTAENLLTSQLPHSDDPGRLWELANGAVAEEEWEIPAMEHDLAYYSVSPELDRHAFLAEMNASFFAKPLIARLVEQLPDGGIHFGDLKQWIRTNCTDVPVPGARELTFVVQGLMGWFPFLAPEVFEVVVPGRHSELLRHKTAR